MYMFRVLTRVSTISPPIPYRSLPMLLPIPMLTLSADKKATKAAEAEALHRLRSLINSTARSLSASWFSLLTTVPATVAAARGTSRSGRGGDGGGGDGVADGSGNANDDATEGAGEKSGDITATVPAIIIRRLCQDCGIVRSNAGGPTLAHADMELQRNALGKGGRSFGHREVGIGHSR